MQFDDSADDKEDDDNVDVDVVQRVVDGGKKYEKDAN